jgi:hypothetical protein
MQFFWIIAIVLVVAIAWAVTGLALGQDRDAE